MQNGQQISGKSRLRQRLQQISTLCQKFNEKTSIYKADIQSFSKIQISYKLLWSVNAWH